MATLKSELQQSQNIGTVVAKTIKLLNTRNDTHDEIVRNLAPGSTNLNKGKQLEKDIEYTKNVEKFKGEVYNINNIKDLCIKYKLKFLNTQYYQGKIDENALTTIQELSDEKVIDKNAYDLAQKYFIIARKESFYSNPVRDDGNGMLFYKIDNTTYKLIGSWGQGYSWTRLIQGFMWKSPNNKLLVIYCIVYSLLSIPLAYSLNILSLWGIFLSFLIPFIPTLLYHLITFNIDNGSHKSFYFTPINYDWYDSKKRY